MRSLERPLNERLRRTAARLHVALIEHERDPFPREDPGAIVAGVPWVRLSRGTGEFSGRRRRLRIGNGACWSTVLGRVRPMPAGPERTAHVEFAEDARGERCAIAVADRAANVLHVLLDVARAQLVTPSAPDGDDVDAAALFERPLAALVPFCDESLVGVDVVSRVHSLLARRWDGRQDASKREAEFLRRMEPLPAALARRLALLDECLARPETPPDATLEHGLAETARLRCLVESRAVGALRILERGVAGVLSPRPHESCTYLPAIGFALSVIPAPYGLMLRLWDHEGPQPADGHAACLGQAIDVLARQVDAGDLYGVVDTVLNFVETNRIFVRPYAGRSFVDSLEELF